MKAITKKPNSNRRQPHTRRLSERAWVRKVLRDYDLVEAKQPKLSKHDFDWPDWVFKLLQIFIKISHPGLSVKTIRQWRAKDLGLFLGRQSAGEHLFFGEVPISEKMKTEAEMALDSVLSARGLNNPEGTRRLQKYMLGMKKWRIHFQRFIRKVLAEAKLRPYEESSAFFEAFGKANVFQPDDFDTDKKIGVGERIAWVMFLHWEFIATLENVSQLQRLLQKAAEPHGIVIGKKRIEALCRRIGLKFKAKRGRPKGNNPKI